MPILRSDGFERWNWKYDSKHQTENRWWLWKLKLRMRLWTSNWEVMMALNIETDNVTLNIKLRSDDGSERRNWKATMMTLNAEIENAMRMTLNADIEKWWLWTPKLRSGDDFERWNWKYDFEHQTKNRWWLWTPKLRMRLWTSNWEVMMALNVETENAMRMTLNTDTEKWWWWL